MMQLIDNVDYLAGRKAFRNGDDFCPYTRKPGEYDKHYNQWVLGWENARVIALLTSKGDDHDNAYNRAIKE